jgi:thiol-disulfide isomerase/thioredoxin
MDFFTGSQRRRRSTRRRTSSRKSSSQAGRVMDMTSASGPQLRAFQNMLSRGPLTLVLVYSPSCPHCHTYMPMWEDLCKTKDKQANLVRMKAEVYDKTPLSEQKRVTGVPSVLYVDTEGRVTEAENIRNQTLMKNVVKTASPEPEPEEEPTTVSVSSDIFRPEEAPINPVMPPAMPIQGSEARENPLEPVPALPVQQGGSPWAAFLMSAARQAAPAAALLGAYAALPTRSSGLPAASRRRRRTRRGRSSGRRHQ